MAIRNSASRTRRDVHERKPGAKRAQTKGGKQASAGKGQPATPAAGTAAANTTAAKGNAVGLRVRMYRVGFGDFFLLTAPTAKGPKHILIDCGVHAGDIHSIDKAVNQMAQETNSNLALVIMTHRHADHISGFATCKEAFSKFNVERVWMSWFENPANETAAKFQQSLTDVAMHLHASLAARADKESEELSRMAENITGFPLALGGGSNSVALDVLHKFKGAAYNYYKAGDAPTLPDDLAEAGLQAQILGPPIDENLVSQMDGRNHQYLGSNGESDTTAILPFSNVFNSDASKYPHEAFEPDKQTEIERLVREAQPDLLAARARQADNTLNNQSLVVLFTFQGKKLLFVGDAQWGNWENFLFGGAFGTAGHSGLTDGSKSILGALDFYKVGHHGSTNATPIDAVNALREGCVAMCSTQPGCYGSTDKGTEVPRLPLLDALEKKTNHQLVRSDQIKAGDTQKTNGLNDPGSPFKVPEGELFIDYNL